MKALRPFLLFLLFCGPLPAWAERVDGMGEAPVIAGLLEAGMRAERLGAHQGAESRLCAAARLGSSEAQYQLGRMYLTHRGLGVSKTVAVGLLSMAAQMGHRPAQILLAQQNVLPGDALPPCLERDLNVLALKVDDALSEVSLAEMVTRLSPSRMEVVRLLQKLAPAYDVDPQLALAIARVESNFNPDAISPKNAMGVMQLIPATAARFAVRDPLDAEQNVRGGLAYLRWLLTTFDGDVLRVAAAYNAGEGNVMRHGGVPPFNETREYVRRVLALYGADHHRIPSGRLIQAHVTEPGSRIL